MNAFESIYLNFLPTKRDHFESIKFDLSKKAELIAVDADGNATQVLNLRVNTF